MGDVRVGSDPDRAGQDDGSASVPVDGPLAGRADPALLERAQGLLDVPLAERPDAFDRLNHDVAASLRAIEDA